MASPDMHLPAPMRLVPGAAADEDSLLFRLCFYYGLLVVLLEVVVPLVFRRRLRLALPAAVRLPQAPPVLSRTAFTRQKTQLGARIRKLQRAAVAKDARRASLRPKATPAERTTAASRASASERRASKTTSALAERRARSTGKLKAKRLDASNSRSTSSASATARLQELRRLRDDLGQQSAAHDSVWSPVYQQPSRLHSDGSSRMGASVEPTAMSSTPASLPSPEVVRLLSPETRASTGSRSASSSLSDTKKRRELCRKSLENENAGGEEEETKEETAVPEDEVADGDASEPQASPSFYMSSYRSGVYATATTSRSFNEQNHLAKDTVQLRKNSIESGRPEEEEEEEEKEYQAFHYEESCYSDDDESVETFEADVPKRSIGRFTPAHQSIFDESDEEFLTVIRRPRGPVATTFNRTFTNFGDEQMDVERTIAAAFGGRPRGGGGAAATMSTYYQPVAPTPPPAPAPAPAPSSDSQRSTTSQARQDLIHMYSQQRRQFVTRRRESPANEEPTRVSGAATRISHNYQEVVRDRTPRIIRRIAFDEEMMALAATPEPRAYATMAQAAQEADFTPAGEKRKHSVIFSPEDEAPDFSRRRTRL